MNTHPSDHNHPRFTIIATFYNQERWVRQCLDSVLAQRQDDVQLIITDDCSTDGSREAIQSWLRSTGTDATLLANSTNIGIAATLNNARPLVRGHYVAVLNGDDWMPASRLWAQGRALDAAPTGTGLVYSDLAIVDIDGIPTGRMLPGPDRDKPSGNVLLDYIARPTVPGIGSTMFRRTVLDQVGPWDESLAADDFDFLLRAAMCTHFQYVAGTVLFYRRHSNSLTASYPTQLAVDRVRSLLKLKGISSAINRAVAQRVIEHWLALRSMQEHPSYHLRILLAALALRPPRAVLRQLVYHVGSRSKTHLTHDLHGRP